MGERKVFERIKDIKPSPGPLQDELRYYQEIIKKFSEPRPQRFVDSKGTHIIKTAWSHVGNYMEILENVSKNINVKNYLAEYSKRKNRKPPLKYLTDLNQDDFKNIKIPHPDPTFYKPYKMPHKMYMKKLYNLNILKLPPTKSNLKGINEAASMQPSISSLYKIILKLRDFGLASDALRENDAALRTYTLTIRRLFYILVFIKDQIKNVAKQDDKLKELLEELTLRTDDSSNLLSKHDVKKYVLRAQAMLKERQQLEELATITSSALLEKAKKLKILRGNKTNIDEITVSDVPFFPKHPKYIPWQTIMKLTADNDEMIKDVKKALQTSVDALLNREESINVLMEVPFIDDPKGSDDPDKESLEFKNLKPDEKRELREIVKGAFNGILGDKETELTVYDKDSMAKKLTGDVSDDIAESTFLDILHKSNIHKTKRDEIQEAAHYTSGLTSPSTGSSGTNLLPYTMFTDVNFNNLSLVDILENDNFYVNSTFDVTPGRTTNINEITDTNIRTIAEILKGNTSNAAPFIDNLTQIMNRYDNEVGPKVFNVKPAPITAEAMLNIRYGRSVPPPTINLTLIKLTTPIGLGGLLITKIQNLIVELILSSNPSTNIRRGVSIDLSQPNIKLDIAKYLEKIKPARTITNTNFILEVLIGISRIGKILQPPLDNSKKTKAADIMKILVDRIKNSKYGGYEWKPPNFNELRAYSTSRSNVGFLKGGGSKSNLKEKILNDILQNIDSNNKINLKEYISIGEFIDELINNQTGGELDINFSEAPPIVLDSIIKYNANLFSPRNNDKKKIKKKDMIVQLKKTLNQKIDSKLSNECLESEAPGLFKALTYLRSQKGMRHLLDRVSVVFPDKILTETDYLMAGSDLNFNNGVGININSSSILEYIQNKKCNDYTNKCQNSGDPIFCNNICTAKFISDHLFIQNPELEIPDHKPNYYFNGIFVNFILTKIIEELPNMLADLINSDQGVRGFAYKKLVKYASNNISSSILGTSSIYDTLKFKPGSTDSLLRGQVGEIFALENYLDRIELMKPPDLNFEERIKYLIGITYPIDLKDDSKKINKTFKVRNNRDKFITINYGDLTGNADLEYNYFAGLDPADKTKQKPTPLNTATDILLELDSLITSKKFTNNESLKFIRQTIVKILKPMIVFTDSSESPFNSNFINNQYKSHQYTQFIIDIFTIPYLYKATNSDDYYVSNLANDLKHILPGLYYFFKINQAKTNFPNNTLWSGTVPTVHPDIERFIDTASMRDIEKVFKDIGSPLGPKSTPENYLLANSNFALQTKTIDGDGKLLGGGKSKIYQKNNNLYYQIGKGFGLVLPKEFKDWLMSTLDYQVELGLVPTTEHKTKMLSFMEKKSDKNVFVKISNIQRLNKIAKAFAKIFTQNGIIIKPGDVNHDLQFLKIDPDDFDVGGGGYRDSRNYKGQKGGEGEEKYINLTELIIEAFNEQQWNMLDEETNSKLKSTQYLVYDIYQQMKNLDSSGELEKFKINPSSIAEYEKSQVSKDMYDDIYKKQFTIFKNTAEFERLFLEIKNDQRIDNVVKLNIIDFLIQDFRLTHDKIKPKWNNFINSNSNTSLTQLMSALNEESNFNEIVKINQKSFNDKKTQKNNAKKKGKTLKLGDSCKKNSFGRSNCPKGAVCKKITDRHRVGEVSEHYLCVDKKYKEGDINTNTNTNTNTNNSNTSKPKTKKKGFLGRFSRSKKKKGGSNPSKKAGIAKKIKDSIMGIFLSDHSMTDEEIKKNKELYEKCKYIFKKKIANPNTKLNEEGKKRLFFSIKSANKYSCGGKKGKQLYKALQQEDWCNKNIELASEKRYIKQCKQGTFKKKGTKFVRQTDEVVANLKQNVNYITSLLEGLNPIISKPFVKLEKSEYDNKPIIIPPLVNILNKLIDLKVVADDMYFINSANKLFSELDIISASLDVEKQLINLVKKIEVYGFDVDDDDDEPSGNNPQPGNNPPPGSNPDEDFGGFGADGSPGSNPDEDFGGFGSDGSSGSNPDEDFGGFGSVGGFIKGGIYRQKISKKKYYSNKLKYSKKKYNKRIMRKKKSKLKKTRLRKKIFN